MKINPSMPYHNPRCKYVNYWFSSVDAFEPWIFNSKIQARNIDELEEENGVCILSTHFGKYFVEDGKINHETKTLLSELAKRNGWFAPASEILDYLLEAGSKGKISTKELLTIQWKWVVYKIMAAKYQR